MYSEKKINLITFTIAGTEYQAEEGMTWNEFMTSSYNTNRTFYLYIYDVAGVATNNSTGTYCVVLASNMVVPTDTIIDGTTYGIVIVSSGSGGGA